MIENREKFKVDNNSSMKILHCGFIILSRRFKSTEKLAITYYDSENIALSFYTYFWHR